MKQKIKLGDNETEIDSLTQDEVEGLLDKKLDEKLSALELPETFDADAFKTDILDSVTNLFKEHESKPLDEDAFLKKVSKTFDDRLSNALKGIPNGSTKERGPGILSRYLSS